MNPTRKDILAFFRSRSGRPLLVREIMRQMKIKPGNRREVKDLMAEMTAAGELIRTRGNRYGMPERMDIENGAFQAHPAGFGFVLPERKGKPDIYIPAAGRLDAMDGDRVAVRIAPPAGRRKAEGRREGAIIRILERAHTKIVGTYEPPGSGRGGIGFVTPSSPRLVQNVVVAAENAGNARPGDIVAAEILSYPLRGRPAEGRIVRVIGRPGEPGIETELIIEEYELPVEFSSAARDEATRIPAEVPPSLRRGRKDLRELTTVTIDGEKARDFDDAISISRVRGGYRLWVHIADVAQYVKEGSFIDQEAYRRGTSVYFPDRAVPMLPEQLSNGICSLNPRVDRLTLTVEMDFTPQGALARSDVYESVINSNERMTYTAVGEIVEDRDPLRRKRYASLLGEFELMDELMEVLRSKRAKRGSIDFDLPEPEIVLDIQGRLADIIRARRNRAHRIVEEFMLAANEAVAAHLEDRDIPLLYRVHEEPDEEKLGDLVEFLATLGITLPAGRKIKSLHLQKALAKVKDTPEEALVNTVVLRTMKQARYLEENAGHFGLAAGRYTHFTSPIRRYPDLVVHRIMKNAMRGKYKSGAEIEKLAATLPETAAHCSQRERTAMEAERDVVQGLKLLFMRDRVGEEEDGIITGAAPFGFFVQLSEVFVEGMVHVSTLADDYYHYVEKLHCLRGERKKRVFRIGDRVRVRVDRVDTIRKRIDFSLAEP